MLFFLFVPAADAAPPAAVSETGAFLAHFWARPLPPQGPPPASYSTLEADLVPSACGTCHVDQHRDWSRSLHRRAMGPGVLGQLKSPALGFGDAPEACLRCHAPLAEQEAALAQPAAGNGLHRLGVTCAACHVRGHVRHGPKRRDGSAPAPGEALPHGGWVASDAYEDARFCSACHQFPSGGFALNGKLLENTYEEWRGSPHAAAGRTCQSCHMPDRRHLWRGIHDPEMTARAMTIRTEPVSVKSGQVATALRLANSGAGHRLPTYVTPRLLVRLRQEDGGGRTLPGTQKTWVIGREVALDLSREIRDTRIAPGEEVRIAYRRAKHSRAAALVFEVVVEPDHFYTRFYRSVLAQGGHGAGEPLLRQALRESEQSRFTVFSERRPL